MLFCEFVNNVKKGQEEALLHSETAIEGSNYIMDGLVYRTPEYLESGYKYEIE